MAGPGDGPPGKDEEGRQLLQALALEESSREAGAERARSLRWRRAGGVLFVLLAAVALLAVCRPAPTASGASAASGAGLTGLAEGTVGLAELPEGTEEAELPEGLEEVEPLPARETLEVGKCKYFSRRRRADKCTACDSGPRPDPGCGPLFLHTDGFAFSFSVEVTVVDVPKEGADIIVSSTGAFRFAVEGSEDKKGIVSFQFKPLNKPLSRKEAEALEAQMEARGQAWEEMTSTTIPKVVNDLHNEAYYWAQSAQAYGFQNRRLEGLAGDFFQDADYQTGMYQVQSVAPLETSSTFIINVEKSTTSLCLSMVPKGSDWLPRKACSKALYAETDAYSLYQMLPPGDLFWGKGGSFGIPSKPFVKARSFKVLNDNVPFLYSVVGVEYGDLVKADALEVFHMAMNEGISIVTGVPISQISVSSAVGPLRLIKGGFEASLVKSTFKTKASSIHVSVTLHDVGSGSEVLRLQERVRTSMQLETAIAVRVKQVLQLVGSRVMVVNVQAPPQQITKCGSFKCPPLSKPDITRSCIGGDCVKVCCTVEATCAEYKGCQAPYYKKKLSLFRRCWGEKQCAEVCCERSCDTFMCAAYWSPIKEKHDTYCDAQPKWALKCKGTAYGSDENCGDECCFKVSPPCCTDKNLAFCRACQTCTNREGYCTAHGQETDRRLQEPLNETSSRKSEGVAKPKTLLQLAKKEPSEHTSERALLFQPLRGCKAYPRTAYTNQAYYGVPVKDCNQELLVKFTLHSKKGNAAVTSVRVLPDALHAVSGGEDGNAWIWSLKTGLPVSVFDHGAGKAVNAVAAMADAEHVVSGGNDNVVYVWKWRDAFATNQFEVSGNAAGVNADRPSWDYPIDAAILGLDNQVQWSVVAIASADGYFRIFDYRHGNVARLPPTPKSEAEVQNYWKNTFDMSANREIGGLDGTAQWHLDQTADSPTNPRNYVPPFFHPPPPWEGQYGTKWGKAISVTFVPITSNCAVGYEDGMIRYWDAYKFSLISEFGPGHKAGPILAMMAMQAAPYIFTGGMDGWLRKFHVPSGEQVWAVDLGFGGAVRSVTVVPASSRVIVGSDDGYVRMYDGGSGNPICQQNTGGGRVNSVTFNPGRLGQFLTANQDGVARVFR